MAGSRPGRRAICLLVLAGVGGAAPWIGGVKGCEGVVLASGHSCWGIQNGPGTGKCVSEILLEGVCRSAVLGPLDPKRSL